MNNEIEIKTIGDLMMSSLEVALRTIFHMEIDDLTENIYKTVLSLFIEANILQIAKLVKEEEGLDVEDYKAMCQKFVIDIAKIVKTYTNIEMDTNILDDED